MKVSALKFVNGGKTGQTVGLPHLMILKDVFPADDASRKLNRTSKVGA